MDTLSGKGIGGHQSHAAQTTTWLTPPEIIAALGEFDLDPCGFWGWETAKRLIVLPEDGLASPWGQNERVWLNPPYGNEAWVWLSKLADHGNGVALIFARTETLGFVREVWGRADGILFLSGRLHFYTPDGIRAKANAGAPSALVAYGGDNVNALANSGLDGALVSRWRNPSDPSGHLR